MATNVKEKVDVYSIVTERFTEQLKKGIVPWEKPWIAINGERIGAWSHSAQSKGQPYSVINQMMLPHEGEYITYRDIVNEGGRLKEGAKPYIVCFWKSYRQTVRNNRTNVDEEKLIPVLRYYKVYALEDTIGIKQRYQASGLEELEGLKEPQRCKRAEEIAKTYLESSGVKLIHRAGDRAYYVPFYDQVVLPLKKQFSKKSEYYSTLFHELTHSTGHKDRLNRLGTFTKGRGKDYSLEELVAEIGAAASMYNLGIETKDSIKNSNAYLAGWLRALGNDNKMIVKASARAQKAVRYLFGETDVPACRDTTKQDYTEPTPTELEQAVYPDGCPF